MKNVFIKSNYTTTFLLSILFLQCVTDNTHTGRIPTIGYQSLEGIDTITVGTNNEFNLRSPVLPQCQNGSTDLGALVLIEFVEVEISLLDTTKSLSFLDSLYVEVTSTNQRFTISYTKIDSLVGFSFSFLPVPIMPNNELELCHLNQIELHPIIRFRYRQTPTGPSMLRVRLIFNIGRING